MSDNRLKAALRRPELIEAPEPAHVIPVGHRGAPRLYPENTLESLVRAVELGAWMVELDVRQAKDGTLVVFHDAELQRMTGAKGTVQAASWKDLAKLSVEGWFKIPRLDDVLVLLREKSWIDVEIKQADAARVAETLKRHGMTDQVVVSSFDWDVLAALEKADPTIARGLLTEEKQDAAAALAKHRATGWFPRADLVDGEMVAQVHAAGGYLLTWTVDDPAAMRSLAALGVDGICSNDVEELVRAVA